MNRRLEIEYDNYMMTAGREAARTYGKRREQMKDEIEDAHGCALEKARSDKSRV